MRLPLVLLLLVVPALGSLVTALRLQHYRLAAVLLAPLTILFHTVTSAVSNKRVRGFFLFVLNFVCVLCAPFDRLSSDRSLRMERQKCMGGGGVSHCAYLGTNVGRTAVAGGARDRDVR